MVRFTDEEAGVQKGLSLPQLPQLGSGRAGFKARQLGFRGHTARDSSILPFLPGRAHFRAAMKACIETGKKPPFTECLLCVRAWAERSACTGRVHAHRRRNDSFNAYLSSTDTCLPRWGHSSDSDLGPALKNFSVLDKIGPVHKKPRF